jgi:hypothetical protein
VRIEKRHARIGRERRRLMEEVFNDFLLLLIKFDRHRHRLAVRRHDRLAADARRATAIVTSS